MKKIQSAISFFAYDNLLNHCRDIFSKLPDSRSGKNIVYSMEDAAMGAFSVFFTQSPSFLDFQRNMELAKGQSNAQSLFEISDIPTDNQIRNILDPVSPSKVFPCFSGIINRLYESGYFDPYKSVNRQNKTLIGTKVDLADYFKNPASPRQKQYETIRAMPLMVNQ